MLQKFVKTVGGNPHKRQLQQLSEEVEAINELEPDFEQLPDEALQAKTLVFKTRIKSTLESIEDEQEYLDAEQGLLEEILPEAFALVREASKRTIGLRHYDVQLIGGIVLHRGQIAEMKTGEGKTLVATLPLYLNGLTGRGTHLVTVNDYLARRDARWMAPIFQMLGLSVGVLQMAAATENGKKAFLVDFNKESPHEDQQHLRLVDRIEAYAADVTYGTNSEFGFDYLRDNMTMRMEDRVQSGHYYAIVDEVDNVLIDEARTPLIISGPAQGDLEWYGRMAQIVKQLKPEDYEVNEKDRATSLTEVGMGHVESLLGQPLMDPDRPEDVTPEQARLTGYLEQALRAQYLFQRNKDYLVQGGKVVIVDEFTGRLMPGRRWSDGLHQAVEAKEGVRVEPENVTYATITLQNYFRMYKKLAGMTGTALTEAEEFSKIYKLEVTPIPTNLEYQAFGASAPLVEIKAKDDENYQYSYYARRDDGQNPVFYRRKDYPDVIYRTVESKLRALAGEIVRYNALGRPLLVGTTSVESSERLSNRLRAESVRRLLQVGLVRHSFVKIKNREEDGRLIPELLPFNEPLENITPDSLRKFAGTFGQNSISLEDPTNFATLLELLRLPTEAADRLKTILQSGVPHQVLNARKHTEESQIIAGAGAFGAVTIATNMAGRGVDIKLGGEIAEEVIAAVNRVLRRAGFEDPFDMPLEDRRQALQKVDAEQYGLYEGEVKLFLQYFEDMERVKQLGGLHVIGSERHEARRIDNQLRGRAARQGDPGSSRFYLSLEDDLMRLFGGEQVSGLMQRLKVDDTLPLEARMVSGIIENSQHRVEGANFDVRKHLLEYDDVLNKQREQIYSQRDRIFTKQDLTEDVEGMLQTEVESRVQAGLVDEEGPWKLIAWLEQVQPPFESEGRLIPTYGLQLILNDLNKDSDLRKSLIAVIVHAVEVEHGHAMRAIESLIDRTEEGLEAEIAERIDAVDAFFESQRDSEEPLRPQKAAEELSGLIHLPLRLTGEQSRQLADDPAGFKKWLGNYVEGLMIELNVSRIVGAIENRLGENLGEKIDIPNWNEATEKILNASRVLMQRQRERLTSQVESDLEILFQRESGEDDSSKVRLLMSLSQGARTVFDQRTHRQGRQIFSRFSYVYLAAQLLENRNAEEVTESVLDHLEIAEKALQTAWGQGEYSRLSQNAGRLADFGPAAQVFGDVRQSEPVSNLSEADREQLIQALGSYILNEVKRQLLLSAITELWVEYLTKVEALRVSIGLEAYAQRDPLVQYKGRASELFQQLFSDVRAAVIGRVFAYQPRRIEITPTEVAETSSALPSGNSSPMLTGAQVGPAGGGRRSENDTRGMSERVTAKLTNYTTLPKVELHRHLEGSLRLDTLLDIARQHEVTIPEDELQLSSLVQMQAGETFSPENFLAKFNTLRLFYRSPEIIHRITREAIEDAAIDNVRYMELRFTPVALSRAESFPLHDVLDWVTSAARQAAQEFGLTVKLITSVNRHESPELAEQVAWLALEHREDGVVGMDLAGNEAEFKSDAFYGLFKEARQSGLHVTIHAGEWGPATNVKEAIEELGAERIGHGVRVLEDETIIRLAQERGTAFEVCVTSNYQSGVVETPSTHPLTKMLQSGLNVTVNTDDPSISRITLSHEYSMVCDELGLSDNALKILILAAGQAAFLPEDERGQLVGDLKKELKLA